MFLTVNEKGFIKNVQSVFSGSSKIISEAIQNARRAGATRIDIEFNQASDDVTNQVVFTDNGHGIKDFSKLLTVAESGWSEETIQRDNPFGMGFMALLCAGKQITIRSGHYEVTWDCQALLDGQEQPDPMRVEVPQQGTAFIIDDFTMPGRDNFAKFRLWVLEEAYASNIQVFLNGEEISRPCAFDVFKQGKTVIETELGTFVFRSFEKGLTCVLQDHVVSSSVGKLGAVVYLNETFKARMPDRDKLLNEREQLQPVLEKYRQLQCERIRGMMASDPSLLALYYDAIIDWDAALLNDIDQLPACAFRKAEMPTCNTDLSALLEPADAPVKKGEVPLVVNNDDPYDVGTIPALFAYEAGALVLRDTLDKEHWIYQSTVELDDKDMLVHGEVKHSGSAPALYNSYVYGKVLIGDFKITHTGIDMTVGITSGVSLDDDNDLGSVFGNYKMDFENAESICMLVSVQAALNDMVCCQSILTASCSYLDEYDCFIESELYQDQEDLEAYIQSLVNDSPEKFIRHLLRNVPKHILERLQSESMVISADEEGALQLKPAA